MIYWSVYLDIKGEILTFRWSIPVRAVAWLNAQLEYGRIDNKALSYMIIRWKLLESRSCLLDFDQGSYHSRSLAAISHVSLYSTYISASCSIRSIARDIWSTNGAGGSAGHLYARKLLPISSPNLWTHGPCTKSWSRYQEGSSLDSIYSSPEWLWFPGWSRSFDTSLSGSPNAGRIGSEPLAPTKTRKSWPKDFTIDFKRLYHLVSGTRFIFECRSVWNNC